MKIQSVAAIILLCLLTPFATFACGGFGEGEGDQESVNRGVIETSGFIAYDKDAALEKAMALIEKRSLTQAFQVVESSFPSTQTHVAHSTELLQMVSGMVDAALAQKNGTISKSAVNYASQIISVAMSNPELAGQGQVEIAYPFMQAICLVGHAALQVDKNLAAAMFTRAGQIARNLETNPRFPREALRGISSSLIVEAKAHAIRNDLEAAANSLQLAYQWGCVDFEIALEDKVLNEIDHDHRLQEISLQARERYQVAVKNRVLGAVSNFGIYNIDFQLNGLDGKLIQRSDFDGKLLVLDLGASWCAPCVQSIPHLKRIQEEYAVQNVKVLNASFETQATLEDNIGLIKRFSDEHELNYDIAVGTDALKGSIAQFQSFPCLVFIDGRGRVRFVTNGYHDFTQISSIIDVILESQDGM